MKRPNKTPNPAHPPMASAKGDLRQLKHNSSATVAELKEFLAQLQGKSPQEMLGVVAASQLFRAIGLSCVIVFVAIVVFTAVPYALGGGAKEEAAEQADAATPANPASPAPATPEPAPAGDPPTPSKADLSKLGVDEEKEAPPNVNPLEDKEDDFLDGLE